MPTLFITGANRGIGLELSRQYRKDGWRVIATTREKGKAGELEKIGAEIHLLDVADIPAIGKLGRELGKETIDLLIANAGIMGPREMPIDKIDAEAWLDVFRVNSIAPLATAAAFRAQVARSQQKKMVAISSVLGSIARNNGGMYVYRSSKTALNMAWKSWSIEASELTSVMLHPGWVRTDMGGPTADVAVEDSAAGLRKVIAGLKPSDNGRFFAFSGEELPW
jgi:NAD(P)-dependent dehydrogenase (short-subunit alcohol dehydrogenase family)